MSDEIDLPAALAAAQKIGPSVLSDRMVLLRQLSLIELTSLDLQETPQDVAALCKQAIGRHGHVASLCLRPQWLRGAVKMFENKPVHISAMLNFPNGDATPEALAADAQRAVELGAHEIDILFPVDQFLEGEGDSILAVIEAVKEALRFRTMLKVVLEVDALPSKKLVAAAADLAIEGGADFLKTGTGRLGDGTNLEAVAILLASSAEADRPVGVAVSGQLEDALTAQRYITLANKIMGPRWAVPASFRLGCGLALLGDITNNLERSVA